MSVVRPEGGFFPITSVHRADLEDMGFDVSGVTDEQMATLAERMGELYVESGAFWDHLEGVAEFLGIPRRVGGKEPEDSDEDAWPKKKVF